MMMSEFIERTGFEPTYEEYAEIEEAYYQFSGNKDEFCKQFVEHDSERKIYEARAQKIAQLRSKMVEMEKDFMETIVRQQSKISALEKSLEAEEEWKPYECESNVKQAEYDDLHKCSGTRGLNDEEAMDIICNEFGFNRQKIMIIHEVGRYEINRHNRLRKVGEIKRRPLYNATDWNYIRFNVHGNVVMSYEMFNGELRMYAD